MTAVDPTAPPVQADVAPVDQPQTNGSAESQLAVRDEVETLEGTEPLASDEAVAALRRRSATSTRRR
jgi:hypothetical protein